MTLRERIIIYKINTVKDASGYLEGTREDIKEVWALVMPMGEKRALEQGQKISNRPLTILTRSKAVEVTSDMFIEWRGKELVIHSVVDYMARGKYYEITAYES